MFQVDYGFALQNEHVAVSFIKKLENMLENTIDSPTLHSI